ncbi:MAG: hypothetical protein CMD83_18025 [Gammaproteobacteria bacterium]|nr:hypothetical protein [Gammaproteobacteria bacterium]
MIIFVDAKIIGTLHPELGETKTNMMIAPVAYREPTGDLGELDFHRCTSTARDGDSALSKWFS